MRPGKSRNPAIVLLLLIVTCGLYYPYWLYVTSCDIEGYNKGHDMEADIPPIVDLLLVIITAGLYLFYWDWKTAKHIARMQSRVGIPPEDNSLLYLILDILGVGPIHGLGVIVPLIQQTNLNQIWARLDARRAF